jgi:protein-S-isoprenylcysteine O-methyltransferase Ste14
MRRDIIVRTFIWICLIALWMRLTLPAGMGLTNIRAGLPRLAGVGLLLGGTLGYAWSVGWLARGAPITQHAPAALLTQGPYRYVRNPLYLSVALVLVGISTLYRPWTATHVAAWAVLAIVVHATVVRFEEPITRRQFGADYEAYCRRVPRWIPGIKR